MLTKHSIDGFPDAAITFRFVRSRGPGGQHVNTAATAVQLRVKLGMAQLPEPVMARLRAIAGRQLTSADELVIISDSYRSQLRNREAALDRLANMVSEARRRPRERVPTKPSAAAKRRRTDTKKQHGTKKRLRRKPTTD